MEGAEVDLKIKEIVLKKTASVNSKSLGRGKRLAVDRKVFAALSEMQRVARAKGNVDSSEYEFGMQVAGNKLKEAKEEQRVVVEEMKAIDRAVGKAESDMGVLKSRRGEIAETLKRAMIALEENTRMLGKSTLQH